MPAWFSPVVSILALILSIITWLAKLKWSREFEKAKNAQIENLESQLKQLAAAKDETIKAKDAQIETLKAHAQNLIELSPAKLKDHMAGISEILEKRIDVSNEDLARKAAELKAAEERIITLQTKPDEVESAEKEQQELTTEVEQLRNRIEQLHIIQSELNNQTPLPSIAYLKELNLVDKNNKIRAVLTTLIDDEPCLYFYGEEGYQPGREGDFRICLGIDDDEMGWQSLWLKSKDNRTNARIGVYGARPTIELESRKPEGATHIQLIIQDDGHPVLYLGHRNSATSVTLELQNDRPPRFELGEGFKTVWRWQDS